MDPRFLQEDGTGIFTGNELIVKGALESQVGQITGYPGSPLAELFETLSRLKELLKQRGVVAQIANNEALAAARLNGSQMERVRAMAVMKNVGMHVAADGLALGNMAGAHPEAGALLVVGDDTWSEGTQVPADSRFLSQHLYMPVLEPATFQEIKDWVGLGFELSRHSRLYLTYLVTSNQADGGGTVAVGPNRFPPLNAARRVRLDTASIAVDERVVIPPTTTRKEREVLEQRLPALLDKARQLGLNRRLYDDGGHRPLGFVASGLAFCYLEHALDLLGLAGRFPILKLGLTYPVDPEAVAAFAAGLDHLCVVEEKRGFLETQIAAVLAAAPGAALWGKRFPGDRPGFPSAAGLHPSLTVQHLLRLFEALPGLDLPPLEVPETPPPAAAAAVPLRTPSFCPGCPHRDSASVLDRLAADLAAPSATGEATTDLVFHGDIGCYSMLKYAPFSRLMHNLSGMGLGGGTGAGIDPFIDNKQVVFMGDSTFFHSGMAAISDSIKNGQDIAYVILDNKTTAMTGHQPTPGVDEDLLGNPTFAQDIERIVRGMAADSEVFVARMDPSRRGPYARLLEEAVLKPGVKIIIADKECGITYHRRQRARRAAETRKKGFNPVECHINIVEDVCENCLECTRGTGCSGLTDTQTLYGPKIAVDRSSCVADGACTRVEVAGGDKTCPSFEEITIYRRQPPPSRRPDIKIGALPPPPARPLDDVWYVYIAGVGGMGINVVSSILAQAGARQGHTVRLTNKKGLAIRNGSVYSHLSFSPDDRCISPLTPYGRAHLLLGLDAMEAARACDPRQSQRVASPQHTGAVINSAMSHTVSTLIGQDQADAAEQVAAVRRHTDPELFFGVDLFAICQSYLGDKLYANTMLLGAAFQRGLLPLALEHLEAGIATALPRDTETNLLAFSMGRQLALDPHCFDGEESTPDLAAQIAACNGLLERSRGKKTAKAYATAVAEALPALDLDEETARLFARRVYDLVQYEDLAYATAYIDQIKALHSRDHRRYGYAATAAAVANLAKVMAIKDEVYVAHLLTCEEKRRRDERRYGLSLTRGDRIRYRHLTRPHIRLFGRDFTPDLRLGDTPLKWVARMRFLRRLCARWWHREERLFAQWYADLVQGFSYDDEASYRKWVRVLRLPEEVSGYRSVRSPKMDAARRRANELLAGAPTAQAPGTLSIQPFGSRRAAR